MTDLVDNPIIEGFICPVCVTSFRTANVLQEHFISQHKTSLESFHSDPSITNAVTHAFSHAFYDSRGGIQAPGHSRSLTSEFLRLRQSHVNRDALETNSLLIRLDKLINAPSMSRSDRRDFEQSIVPWIDAKVSLCPSCGKSFGLGAEPACNMEEVDTVPSDIEQTKEYNLLQSAAFRSKLKLSQLTNAILDYNPVFRRRHHCRLCGHVLCADCSYFLTKSRALRLVDAVDERHLDRIYSNSGTADSPSSSAEPCRSDAVVFLTSSDYTPSLLNGDRSEEDGLILRICSVCKTLLERKLHRLRKHNRIWPIVQMHQELKTLMAKVDETAPSYAAVAESLHSGEQRYALEIAKSMRQGLLESLLKIDNIRRQMEGMMKTEPANCIDNALAVPISTSSIRLIRSISNMTRRYLQDNLPPLRVLPTFEQYGSLAAQRQYELASHWAEEDQLIAELEMRLANKPKQHSTEQMQTTSCDDAANQLLKLAASIDDVSKRLMSARKADNRRAVGSLTVELERLETKFQSLSQRVQAQNTLD